MLSIWYCARHLQTGCYVQYLVLRRTLQWLLCSVHQCVLSSCPIAVLKYCIFCTPVFTVDDTQLAYWFLEPAHSDSV